MNQWTHWKFGLVGNVGTCVQTLSKQYCDITKTPLIHDTPSYNYCLTCHVPSLEWRKDNGDDPWISSLEKTVIIRNIPMSTPDCCFDWALHMLGTLSLSWDLAKLWLHLFNEKK
jgi:hypothetical protein